MSDLREQIRKIIYDNSGCRGGGDCMESQDSSGEILEAVAKWVEQKAEYCYEDLEVVDGEEFAQTQAHLEAFSALAKELRNVCEEVKDAE